MTTIDDGVTEPGWTETNDFPPNPGLIPQPEDGQPYLFMGLSPLDANGYYMMGVWAREDAPPVDEYLLENMDDVTIVSQIAELEKATLATTLYFSEFRNLDVRGVRRTAYATAKHALAALEESGLMNGSVEGRITMINGFYYLWVDPRTDKQFQKRKRAARRAGTKKAA